MSNKKNLTLLCIFGADRQGTFEAVKKGERPSTSFFGLFPFIDGKYPDCSGTFLKKENYLNVGSLRRYLTEVKKVDIIVASHLTWLFVISKIFFPRKKNVLFNIDLNSVLSRASIAKKYLLRLKLAFVDNIVCVSHRQERVLADLGIPQDKISFLANGVDQSFFQKNLENEPRASPQIFLAVGIDIARDYKTLIQAATEVSELSFVIVCSKKNIPEGIPIPGNVTVLHTISGAPKELVRLYAKARAVIVPSLAEYRNVGSDCCGQTVFFEALACGKPVIASERSWIRDYFSEDDPIIMFEPENPHALAGILKSTDFGSVMRPDFVLKYTDQRMAEEWHSFFQGLYDTHTV